MALERFRLDGRAALVTGAGGGIGRATAALLAEAGAWVLASDVDGASLATTVGAVREAGGEIDAVVEDLSTRDAPERLVRAATEGRGRLDVVANVAGILHAGTLADTDDESLDRVLAVNLRAVAASCRAAIGPMERSGGGSIVNVVSSIVARAVPGFAAYAISKGGVVALTKVLAIETAPLGIRVNAVAPGLVATPMSVGRRTDREREEFLNAARRTIPVGRSGEPEDIAYAILYLASEASSYVTGQTLFVNGGTAMPT